MLALLQIVLIDITLAGDNAVVVGLAVAGLGEAQRRRALVTGIAAATLIRVALSAVAIQLLEIVGLTLAGGLLLLWVCWKMFRELREQHGDTGQGSPGKTGWQAIRQIVVADLSMSLDNVLAVAGAARQNAWIMAAGLVLSVVLTGVAAGLLSRLLSRYRWIAWLGLAVVFYVAVEMMASGSGEAAPATLALLQRLPRLHFAAWRLAPL